MTQSEISSTPFRSELRAQRRILLATGAVAAVAGLGAAWWRSHDVKLPAKQSVGEPVDGFWALSWDAPGGGVVQMRSFQGKPLILNFWATWCPPCIEELPLINAFYGQNKANGWQVLGLAVDKPSSVQTFLQKMPLDFPLGLAGLSGAALGRSLGNLAGGLPFTVVIAADGGVVQRKMGRLTPADLEHWARLK
jgi:thiol-disulfide isomerase/thioredoxin